MWCYTILCPTSFDVLRGFLGLLACLFFFFFFLFKAPPMAYGGSQARGQIEAVATGLRHSHIATSDPSQICNLHNSSRQCRILNPLREARDQTDVLMDWMLIGFVNRWARTGTPCLLLNSWFFRAVLGLQENGEEDREHSLPRPAYMYSLPSLFTSCTTWCIWHSW